MVALSSHATFCCQSSTALCSLIYRGSQGQWLIHLSLKAPALFGCWQERVSELTGMVRALRDELAACNLG